jgi:hypothetical protein
MIFSRHAYGVPFGGWEERGWHIVMLRTPNPIQVMARCVPTSKDKESTHPKTVNDVQHHVRPMGAARQGWRMGPWGAGVEAGSGPIGW